MNNVIPYGMDGSTVHKWELVKNLSELGHEVHVLSYEKHENIKSNKIYFHIEPKIDRRSVFNRLSYKLIYSIFLMKLIVSNDFDLLYTRTPAQVNGIVGYMSKRIMGIPIVFEINGIAFEEQKLIRNKLQLNNNDMFNNIIIGFRKNKEIFMWKKADAVIAVTSGIKDYLVRHGVNENKIWVIGNGANTELFKPMDQRVVRSELGLEIDDNYVCFAGNLAPWQGVEYLIQAAPLILKNIKAKFLIIGDGEMKEQFGKMVKELGLEKDFIFFGNVPYENVPKYINASNVCVVPKLKVFGYGYSPLKLFEYMASEKPVVATNTEGFEILEKYNAGMLVNSDNSVELSRAILSILLDKKLAKSMGENGRKVIIEKYSWKKIVERVNNVCKHVTKQNNTI